MSRGRVVAALLVIGPVIVLVFLPTVLGLHRYVVADDAMDGGLDGSIPRGAVALTREVPATDLRVGDVITFRPPAPAGGEPTGSVTRRITAVIDGSARTRGDREDADDPWRLDVTQDTYPRVVFAVPWIGYPFSGDVGQGGWVLLALASLVALLLSAVTPWFRRDRRRTSGETLHAFL